MQESATKFVFSGFWPEHSDYKDVEVWKLVHSANSKYFRVIRISAACSAVKKILMQHVIEW